MKTGHTGRLLRIAQVAPLWSSVPPANYGGIELRLFWLTEELVARGHEVTLFASGDSTTSAKLRAGFPRNLIDAMGSSEAFQYEQYANSNFVEALRNNHEFDVIHCHVGCPQIPLSVLSNTPSLHTMPTALSVDEEWLLNRYPDVTVIAISHSQIAGLPVKRRQAVRVIYHGCDFGQYDLNLQPDKYLVFLGRMGQKKSPLNAIRVAKQAGFPIVLAGKPQDGSEADYFSQKIQPLIDGKNVTYIGPVNQRQKNVLLKNASALLFPIQWEEPFGLVMIEAMACGTPVIACNRGSVSEVVDFGKTGFYADSVEKLASLVPRALLLDRKVVREHAMQRFSHKRMVDEYVEVYESLVRKTG